MKTLEKAFKCEYCSKLYQKGHFGQLHEVYCSKNPKNQYACYNCKHLRFEKQENDGDGYRVWISRRKGFYCNKKSIGLYTHKAEKRGLLNTYPEQFVGYEKMPLECDVFEQGYDESRM